MDRIRVLLVDDHALFREGLAGILAAEPDFEVVGEASDGLEALVKARELAPDLILMDVQMRGADGIEATQRIKLERPATTIVMLTVRDDEEALFEAIQSGAQGYLLKNVHSSDMIALLRGAVRGDAAINPSLAGRMLEEFRRLAEAGSDRPDEPAATLSRREQEVLSLVAERATDKEIADVLHLSLSTVKSHMRNILAKLHVSSRHDAARFARRTRPVGRRS
ncbi:MAG: response regulator transcription factor [Deltaproteobacteria bacterium]|nr:response regulator transcription factor [Deltaproteobacteria bacterium]